MTEAETAAAAPEEQGESNTEKECPICGETHDSEKPKAERTEEQKSEDAARTAVLDKIVEQAGGWADQEKDRGIIAIVLSGDDAALFSNASIGMMKACSRLIRNEAQKLELRKVLAAALGALGKAE